MSHKVSLYVDKIFCKFWIFCSFWQWRGQTFFCGNRIPLYPRIPVVKGVHHPVSILNRFSQTKSVHFKCLMLQHQRIPCQTILKPFSGSLEGQHFITPRVCVATSLAMLEVIDEPTGVSMMFYKGEKFCNFLFYSDKICFLRSKISFFRIDTNS